MFSLESLCGKLMMSCRLCSCCSWFHRLLVWLLWRPVERDPQFNHSCAVSVVRCLADGPATRRARARLHVERQEHHVPVV